MCVLRGCGPMEIILRERWSSVIGSLSGNVYFSPPTLDSHLTLVRPTTLISIVCAGPCVCPFFCVVPSRRHARLRRQIKSSESFDCGTAFQSLSCTTKLIPRQIGGIHLFFLFSFFFNFSLYFCFIGVVLCSTDVWNRSSPSQSARVPLECGWLLLTAAYFLHSWCTRAVDIKKLTTDR